VTTINQTQRDTWNGDSGHRWVADADRRDAVLAPVADTLLAAARIQPGESVLDLGCGCGATTITAATQAGPGGTAHGIDLSEPMLAVARQRARDAGLTTVSFTQADAQTHQFAGAAPDVVISRFGTMFFDDPVAAFTNLARSTRTGGRLCAAVWQARDRSPLLQHGLDIAAAAAAARGHHVDVGVPTDGPFAYGDPAFVRPRLEAAGWVDVTLTPHTLDMYLFGPGTVEDSVETGLMFGPVHTALDNAPAAVVDAVRDALVDDLASRHDGTGVPLSGAISILTARVG